MEMLIYIILSLLLAIAPLAVRTERAVHIFAGLFFGVQVVAVTLLLCFGRMDSLMLYIFKADTLAVVFHILMTAVLGFTLIHSSSYLKAENVSIASYKAYYTILMLLALAISCVYYSDNVAMTWVFLEYRGVQYL